MILQYLILDDFILHVIQEHLSLSILELICSLVDSDSS